MIVIKHKTTGDTVRRLRTDTLERANLCSLDLQSADMEGMRLGGASLRFVNLRNADLRGADLVDANLEGGNLEWTCLFGANLEGANLEGVRLHGAVYDHTTRWPAGFDCEQLGAIYLDRQRARGLFTRKRPALIAA